MFYLTNRIAISKIFIFIKTTFKNQRGYITINFKKILNDFVNNFYESNTSEILHQKFI